MKEFKYTIDGQEYKVQIEDVEGNIASGWRAAGAAGAEAGVFTRLTMGTLTIFLTAAGADAF